VTRRTAARAADFFSFFTECVILFDLEQGLHTVTQASRLGSLASLYDAEEVSDATTPPSDALVPEYSVSSDYDYP